MRAKNTRTSPMRHSLANGAEHEDNGRSLLARREHERQRDASAVLVGANKRIKRPAQMVGG